jgi:hypothetical protein
MGCQPAAVVNAYVGEAARKLFADHKEIDEPAFFSRSARASGRKRGDNGAIDASSEASVLELLRSVIEISAEHEWPVPLIASIAELLQHFAVGVVKTCAALQVG